MPSVDRYQNPQLVGRLAAEYVLGTLRGRARQRFARLMDERTYIRAQVQDWEQRLDPLGELVPECRPPKHVWLDIRREVAQLPRTRPARRGVWQNLLVWRFAAVTAGVLLLTTVLLPLRPAATPPMPHYVAVLEAEGKGPMMVATGTGKPWTLTISPMDDMDMPEDEEMRLWCYPKGGGKPIPMGMVAAKGPTVFKLTQKEWDNMSDMSHLAVSVEPKGSRKNPNPQGPMMYMGKIMGLSA